MYFPTQQAHVFSTVVSSRHSCRSFLATPVPDDQIRQIFTLAQQTPSWCNTQPWQVNFLSGEQRLTFAAELTAHAAADQAGNPDLQFPADYEGEFGQRRRASGRALFEAVGLSRDDLDGRARQSALNYEFFGAPHVAIISVPASLREYALVDAGGYVATLMLVATSFGLGTIAQASIARYSPFVRSYFNLGQEQRVVCAVSFGYADETNAVNAFRTDRSSIDEAVIGLPK
jgi:nitroreductase